MATKLNLKEMAAEFGKTEKTFRKYVKLYNIPHSRFGRGYVFNPVRVEQHMEDLTRSNEVATPDLKATPVRKSRAWNATVDTQRYADLVGL